MTEGRKNMKEFNVNGAVIKCYPIAAAQRMHNYTVKYCPCHQVLNILKNVRKLRLSLVLLVKTAHTLLSFFSPKYSVKCFFSSSRVMKYMVLFVVLPLSILVELTIFTKILMLREFVFSFTMVI